MSESTEARALEFEALFEPILDRAFAVACGFCRNKADAENLVQEAALRAFKAFDGFHRGTNFKAWFMRILSNCYFEQLRRLKRRPEVCAEDQNLDLFLFFRFSERQHDQTADEFWSHMQGEEIVCALRALPAEFASVATLYFVENCTYEEIAGHLNVPTGTVRSRLHRARKLLQANLWRLASESGLVQERVSS